jgi:hypothetical protein
MIHRLESEGREAFDEWHPLSRNIGGDLKSVDDYISQEDVERAEDIIVQAINE